MYRTIKNPKTGRNVSIYSKLGKQIVRNYLRIVDGGSGHREPEFNTGDIVQIGVITLRPELETLRGRVTQSQWDSRNNTYRYHVEVNDKEYSIKEENLFMVQTREPSAEAARVTTTTHNLIHTTPWELLKLKFDPNNPINEKEIRTAQRIVQNTEQGAARDFFRATSSEKPDHYQLLAYIASTTPTWTSGNINDNIYIFRNLHTHPTPPPQILNINDRVEIYNLSNEEHNGKRGIIRELAPELRYIVEFPDETSLSIKQNNLTKDFHEYLPPIISPHFQSEYRSYPFSLDSLQLLSNSQMRQCPLIIENDHGSINFTSAVDIRGVNFEEAFKIYPKNSQHSAAGVEFNTNNKNNYPQFNNISAVITIKNAIPTKLLNENTANDLSPAQIQHVYQKFENKLLNACDNNSNTEHISYDRTLKEWKFLILNVNLT